MNTLHRLGYEVLELLLTPLQFGIPNSRLRYYLLAKFAPDTFAQVDQSQTCVWRHIPGYGQDWVDDRLVDGGAASDFQEAGPGRDTVQLRSYLDEDHAAEEASAMTAIPENVLIKWGRLFDIVLPSAKRTCCFTRGKPCRWP